MIRRLLLSLHFAFAVQAACAHEVRPAYLEIEQHGKTYDITWKQPAMGEMALHLVPHLSNGWLERPPHDQFAATGYVIKTWIVEDGTPHALAGRTIEIEGLSQTITDVLLRVRVTQGAFDAIIHPDKPSLRIEFARHDGLPIPAYLELGVEHILTGVDHLSFVLGLLLLIGVRWQLIKAITAFTVAHSLTLALAALGIVHVPPAIVESLVALSIVFVAAELAHGNPATLTHRFPWIIAFTFGLLHGLAFAGALAEVGLPANAIPLCLFLFNVGVELGQLAFVGAAILIMLAFRRIWHWLPEDWSRTVEKLPTYVIGSFAAFWFIERLVVVFA
jgi:hydrogenase/urease accessory protein HupE